MHLRLQRGNEGHITHSAGPGRQHHWDIVPAPRSRAEGRPSDPRHPSPKGFRSTVATREGRATPPTRRATGPATCGRRSGRGTPGWTSWAASSTSSRARGRPTRRSPRPARSSSPATTSGTPSAGWRRPPAPRVPGTRTSSSTRRARARATPLPGSPIASCHVLAIDSRPQSELGGPAQALGCEPLDPIPIGEPTAA